MSAYQVILALHIFSGFTALFIGLVPILSKKGGRLHKRTGMIYFWAMFGVFFTSSLMFLFKPENLLFLFLVGVFSFYQTFSGRRILKYKEPNMHMAAFDKMIAALVSTSGLIMIPLSAYSVFNDQVGQGIVYLIFGTLLTSHGISDFLRFRNIQNQNSKFWLRLHITRMGGSYIATFTAFVVVNNTFLPPLIAWLGPGVIGGFIIAMVLKNITSSRLKSN